MWLREYMIQIWEVSPVTQLVTAINENSKKGRIEETLAKVVRPAYTAPYDSHEIPKEIKPVARKRLTKKYERGNAAFLRDDIAKSRLAEKLQTNRARAANAEFVSTEWFT